MLVVRLVAALFMTGSLSCASPETDRSDAAMSWRFLDSTRGPSWNLVEDSVTTYRIEARAAGTIDTVSGVIPPLPLTTTDSSVVGLRITGSEPSRELFRLRPRGSAVESIALPNDIWPYFTDVAVSPDGQFVAYVSWNQRGDVAAIVRRLDGSVVLRSPEIVGCDCDVDRNHARWLNADRVEIAVDGSDLGGWLLLAGNATLRRVHLDTLSTEPAWH